MSEKRYVIVSASHHKKPRAMFLSAPANGTEYVWEQGISKALLFTLSQARILAKLNPIGMYFVEHTEAMQSIYGKAEQDKTYFDDFTGYAKHFGYEFICDWRQSENANLSSEPQETPEEKREYVLYRYLSEGSDVKQFYFSYNEKNCYSKNLNTATLYTEDEATVKYIALANAGSKGWFCSHRDAFNADGSFEEAERETPAPKADSESKELSEGYIVYTQSAYQPAYIYYCGDDAKHLDERDIKNAVLFPYVTAAEVAKKLAASSEYSGYTWRVKNKINAAKEETPALEAKKRVGYVLFGELFDGGKVYRHRTEIVAILNAASAENREPADVYMTEGEADFIAYSLNNSDKEFFTWQVEQIEF